VAFPIGGGVNVALTDSIHVFGEGYAAPEGLNNSVKNYVEANGGVSWTPITPVTLKVGYRHVSVDGKDGRPNHTDRWRLCWRRRLFLILPHVIHKTCPLAGFFIAFRMRNSTIVI
jgi:hypothetical protein